MNLLFNNDTLKEMDLEFMGGNKDVTIPPGRAS